MIKIKKTICAIIFSLVSGMPLVLAHCPLCTAGAGIGLTIARAYGVDDSIVGLFFGALVVSSALWFNNWLKKKVRFSFQEAIIVFASFLAVSAPLYLNGTISRFNVVKSAPQEYSLLGLGLLGIDKLLFGIILGTFSILAVFKMSDYLKKKRGKRLFAYQGLIFMILTLIILCLILWRIT